MCGTLLLEIFTSKACHKSQLFETLKGVFQILQTLLVLLGIFYIVSCAGQELESSSDPKWFIFKVEFISPPCHFCSIPHLHNSVFN